MSKAPAPGGGRGKNENQKKKNNNNNSSSNSNKNDGGNDDDKESVFRLIERGLALEKSGDLWGAADAFGQVTWTLRRLSKEAAVAAQNSQTAIEKEKGEQRKIAMLYQKQSQQYLYQARYSFLRALNAENEQDKKQTTDGTTAAANKGKSKAKTKNKNDAVEPFATTLSPEDALRRNRIFSSLFSSSNKTEEELLAEMQKQAAQQQQQLELEERLAKLNATLPSGMKSEEERMAEIHSGLKRLGVSLYSHQEQQNQQHGKQFLLGNTKALSEEEAVAQIISQAKDEAQFMGNHGSDAREDGKDENNALLRESQKLTVKKKKASSMEDEVSDLVRKAKGEVQSQHYQEEEEDSQSEKCKYQDTNDVSQGENIESKPLPLLGFEDTDQVLDNIASAQALLAQAALQIEEFDDDLENCNDSTEGYAFPEALHQLKQAADILKNATKQWK